MTTMIREAGLDDIPALVEMMQEFYAETDHLLDRQWAAASFSSFLQDNSLGAVWIICHDSEPAGYVVLTVRFSMEYGGLDAFIDDLFIRPGHRRQGFGRAVLSALLIECEQRRVHAVHVEVAHDNVAAKALYSIYGLTPRDDGRQLLTVLLGNSSGDE